jgi:hypothetical protein
MAASLAARCHRAFQAVDRDRGAALWRAGGVRLGLPRGFGVEGTVRGSRLYAVEVDWRQAERGELAGFCECPRFGEAGVCKHLWAAVLEIDLRGIARRVPGHQPLVLVDGLGERAVERPDDPGDDAAPSRAPVVSWTRGARPGPPAANPAGLPAAWRIHLGELRGSLSRAATGGAGSEAAGREIWYAADLQATRSHGSLVVRLFQRQRRRDTEWGKLKGFGYDFAALAGVADATDRGVLELLRAFPYSSWGSGGPAHDMLKVNAAAIPRQLYASVVPRLAATGRLVWWEGAGAPTDLEQRWSWDEAGAWRPRIAVERIPAGGVRLRGELVRDGAVRPLEAVVALTPGLVAFVDSVALLEAGETYPWVVLLKRRPVEVPAAEVDAALREIYALPALPTLVGDADLVLREERHPPQPFLRVRRPPAENRWSAAGELEVELGFSYDGTEVRLDDPRSAFPDPARWRMVQRDLEAERQILTAAGELPFHALDADRSTLRLSERQLGEVVDRLLEAGWRVEAEGRPLRPAASLRFAVSSGIDWLDLDLVADFGEQTASVAALLSALGKRQRFVELGDGSRGVLPQEWLDRYGPLASLAGGATAAGLRFARSQALLLDALLAEAPQVDVDAAFSRLRDRLSAGERPQPVTEPAEFAGTLRAYQREGLGWLHFLADVGFGGCLADDMGLGKTVQVLALLAGARDQPAAERLPSLVVAPRSVVHNWLDEARRFAPGLRVLDYGGTDRAELRRRIPEHDLVVTTYGMVRLDAAHLRSIPFSYLVLDEAQAVKNAATQAHKACRLLRARHRLALSGTPVENHLGELWALLELLNPGLLGRFHGRGRPASSEGRPREAELSDAELAAVGRAVRPFILRRTKAQVLSELPAKTEQTLLCTLDGSQRRLYDELRHHYQQALSAQIRTSGLARSKILVLEALLRLRQAACHPGLVDPDRAGEGSAKLDLLFTQLEELREEGHKALVFSQFTRLLGFVKPRLERAGIPYEYLDGRTRDRRSKVERFQNDPSCSVFLVSLKAGGLGLNLTAAGYVFLLDPWWNPAVEAQAVDRAHRIGQTRPVFAYRLIAQDTVEEKILELQQRKRRVADAILAADASVLQALTAEDLELLLS